ncbi:MAG: histidine--tRNA ligase [Pseudomonadales bacterium]|jgi:histidyl-tRNA synthetase
MGKQDKNQKIQALRGMQDLQPEQKETFRLIEDKCREVFGSYGYREIGLPILESTQLFKRAVGEATDVVEKEMYTFDDRNGESVTMRPEGTAGAVRYALQHGLLFNQVQRFWYSGQMFRYERPQKGRYRGFEQIGVECFGMEGPDIDAEILLMCARLWKLLGVDDAIRLELNTLGSAEARTAFKTALVTYLETVKTELDEDSLRRLTTNPMRILDSKVEHTQSLLKGAPVLSDYIDDESKAHFEGLCQQLDMCGIQYTINPTIVRGLDYYNKTVFEWVTDSLGSQGTVCGGGRYDGLVEQIGGKATPGVGFAMGLDRLALMLESNQQAGAKTDIYIASIGAEARQMALRVAESVRSTYPQLCTLVHCGDGKFKAQLKKADASNATLALIIGEDEATNNTITVKRLNEGGEQESITADSLDEFLGNVVF